MAQPNDREPAPLIPPSTPSTIPQPASQPAGPQTFDTPSNNATPTSMNPPPIPRAMMTPARDVREGSVVSSAGGSARKPRQNLDERDHILMVRHCYEQRGNYKEGTKAQFWTGVNVAFQRDTGKVLAQMSATVGRLVEARRRQVADWEAGVIPSKPGGELNDLLDQWMEFLKVEDGDGEAERMKQVNARRKIEEERKEARRQAIAAETSNGTPSQAPPASQPDQARPYAGTYPPTPTEASQPSPLPPPPPPGHMVVTNGTGQHQDANGYRPHKRKRWGNERALTREVQAQLEQQQIREQQWHMQQQQQQQQQMQPHPQHQPPIPHYPPPHPFEPPRRITVEGQLSKDDWKDIMGNDARLRALETKMEKIETLVTQNNKLLLQLLQNQSQPREQVERDRSVEDETQPVHLDAEFERDYLSGRYSKTPLPIP